MAFYNYTGLAAPRLSFVQCLVSFGGDMSELQAHHCCMTL